MVQIKPTCWVQQSSNPNTDNLSSLDTAHQNVTSAMNNLNQGRGNHIGSSSEQQGQDIDKNNEIEMLVRFLGSPVAPRIPVVDYSSLSKLPFQQGPD
ncbi:MAG: hypothetical protein EZS28_038607 [Streblomastix strix]|uniref:Uncharacterized protein n=1 Tax=Streblomastix strix TaxID=222440 RepID=A0A5J4U6B2_9EUKA|nr:MAG: hypothetical protein EZS28_038607 [Streblomastix strix]